MSVDVVLNLITENKLEEAFKLSAQLAKKDEKIFIRITSLTNQYKEIKNLELTGIKTFNSEDKIRVCSSLIKSIMELKYKKEHETRIGTTKRYKKLSNKMAIQIRTEQQRNSDLIIFRL